MGWVPQAGPLGLGVSILSYAGQIRVGVLSDEGLVPNPEALLAAFRDEHRALLALAHQVETDPALRGAAAVPENALQALVAAEDDTALIAVANETSPPQTDEPAT
jgi:hypothetical protein